MIIEKIEELDMGNFPMNSILIKTSLTGWLDLKINIFWRYVE